MPEVSDSISVVRVKIPGKIFEERKATVEKSIAQEIFTLERDWKFESSPPQLADNTEVPDENNAYRLMWADSVHKMPLSLV